MKSSGTDGPPNTVLNVTPRVIDLPPLRIIHFRIEGHTLCIPHAKCSGISTGIPLQCDC